MGGAESVSFKILLIQGMVYSLVLHIKVCASQSELQTIIRLNHSSGNNACEYKSLTFCGQKHLCCITRKQREKSSAAFTNSSTLFVFEMLFYSTIPKQWFLTPPCVRFAFPLFVESCKMSHFSFVFQGVQLLFSQTLLFILMPPRG